jgi:hypothetical protein
VLLTLLPLAACSGAHAQTEAQTPTPTSGAVLLFDAAGTFIGPVPSCSTTSCTVQETAGGVTLLTTRSASFPIAAPTADTPAMRLWFDGPRCSGAVVITNEALIVGTSVALPNAAGSVGYPTTQPATITAVSTNVPAPCSTIAPTPTSGRAVDVVMLPVAVLPYQLRWTSTPP